MYLTVGEIAILASTGVFLLLIGRDLYYGTLAYTIVYFTRPTELFPILGTIRFELVIGCGILALIFMGYKTRENVRKVAHSNIGKALIWFLSAIFISIPFSFGVMKSLEWFIDFLKLLAFCVMIIATIDSDEKVRSFLWLYAILICWVAFVPFVNYLSGNFYYAEGVKRISAETRFFSNPNVLACTIAQSIPLIWVLPFIGKKGRSKTIIKWSLVGVFLALGATTIIFTGSRGGFLTLAGVMSVIWLRSKRKVLVGGFLVLIGALVWMNMGAGYQEHQLTILEVGKSDQSAESRINNLVYAFEMLEHRPLFGYGFGCFANARFILGHGWLWPHNIAAQLIGELGIYGILTFGLFVITVFKTTRKVRRTGTYSSESHGINDALENAFIAQFVIGISQHNLHLYMLYFAASLVVLNEMNAKKGARFRREAEVQDSEDSGSKHKLYVSNGAII